MDKICGIYCIENLINHKKYIGQSKDIYYRWSQHKYKLKNNCHDNRFLQRAWNKYGEQNFKFYIIETCLFKELNFKEIYYIDLFYTHAYFGKHGYNLTTGGEGIGILSKEEIQVFREAQKSLPIYQIDLQGNIINKWDYGARHAAKELGIDQSAIWHCLNRDRRTYKNYIWIYQTDYNDKFSVDLYINNNTQARKIKQYSLDGDLINIWDSANQIYCTLGYDCSCILKICKRKQGIYKNFLWCYEFDDYINKEYIIKIHCKDFINIYDLQNNLIDRLKSQKEVSEKYGLDKSQISQCLKGNKSHIKGYRLKYSA